MKKQTLVDLPDKRITYKKGPNGTKYVYYTLRSYRNAQGKPTSDEKSIGKLDEATGKLIPNRNYYDLFPAERQDYPEAIQSHGYLSAFLAVAESIGLTKILADSFQNNDEILLGLAAYMMAHGNVMMDYSDWAESVGNSKIQVLSSQRISEIFATLTDEDRSRFFKAWLTKAQEDEFIAYDVTSISSYSDEISYVERGYNRDKENLPQINFGMFFGETSRLPLYYSIYPGSIIDKAYLPYMMTLTESLGMNKLRFVMDQGFMTQNNLKLLAEKQHTVLSLVPKNYNLYKDHLTDVIQTEFSARERLNHLEMYSRRIETMYEGVPVNLHFYYDPQKAVLDEKALFDDIQRQEETLSTWVKQSKLKPSLTKYFEVEESGEKAISYRLDYDKIDALRKKLGYFALITTDKALTSEAVLTIYRQKDVIEKSFDELKNGMDYRRMRTHYTQTTDGKMFVAFLGLIMRSVFMTAIKGHDATKSYTLKKVIRELEKIQQVRLKDGTLQSMPLTRVQKDILTALKVDPSMFK